MTTSRLLLSFLWRIAVLYMAFGVFLTVVYAALSVTGVPLPSQSFFLRPEVIKAKPSALLVSFAIFLLFIEFALRKSPLRVIAGHRLSISAGAWKKSTFFLFGLALVLAIVTYGLAYVAPAEVWVAYKALGIPSIILVAIFTFVLMLQRGESDDDA